MKALVLVACFVFCNFAQAALSGEIRSGLCHSPSIRGGTGLVFRKDHQRYLVTSEANVLHGNSGVCHEVTFGGKSARASLVHVDWSRGVALLRLPDHAGGIALDALKSVKARPGLRTFLEGVNPPPQRGRVSVANTSRHDFPHGKHVHEWVGRDMPRSMVGAPALGPNGGVVGLVSNRIIQIRPGKPSALVEWEDPAVQARHLLLLDWGEVSRWVTLVLTQSQPAVPLTLRVADQVQGTRKLYSGNFVFTEIRPKLNAKGVPNGDSPVGGADGIGVGGGKAPAHGSKIVAHPRSQPSPATLPNHLVNRTQGLLAHNSTVEFVLGYDRQATTGELDHLTFHSLGSFFRVAFLGMKVPAVAAKIPNVSPKVHALASAASLKISQYRDWLAFADEPTYRYLRLLYLYTKLLQSDFHTSVNRAKLLELTDTKGKFQRPLSLLTTFPNEGGPLLRLLEALRKETP